MAFIVQLLRPEDLVDLTIEGYNLRLDTTDPAAPVVVRDNAAQDAFLVVVFPPQSFAEQALVEVDKPPGPARGPAGEILPGVEPPGGSEVATGAGNYAARLSGPSRLAFRVPPGVTIPFSIEGLLDWTKLQPSLSQIGAIVGQPLFRRAPNIVEPLFTQTAIELPYRVFLSPGPQAHWRHSLKPRTGGGRTVLWHTRLVNLAPDGQPLELSVDRTAPIRAVYSPDYDADNPPVPATPPEFVMSLKPYDRYALVRLTSTFRRLSRGRGQDIGKPANARRLALTSLGAFLDAHGQWPDGPASFSFSSWTHIAALGRDSYVRVAYRGRLFPLMNRATMIKITERRFEPSPQDGSPVAYLRQYIRILLDEKEVAYAGQPFEHDGREMPLTRVRINVDATPKIENPDSTPTTAPYIPLTKGSFEVKLGTELWPFPCTGTDGAGRTSNFSIGMIFVPEDDIPANVQRVADHWRAMPPGKRTSPVDGAKVQLAPPDPSSETTVFVTTAFRFDAEVGRGIAGFLPRLVGMDVRVPSLELLTGSPKPTAIQFTKAYLQNGFDAAAGLFAEIADSKTLPVQFSADQAGGIVRPDLSVRGFSRKHGPIAGDLAGVTAGTFDPKTAFGPLDAKLFGSLPVHEILGTNTLDEGAPKVTTAREPGGDIVTRLHWQTRTKEKTVAAVTYRPNESTRLTIDAVVRRRAAAAAGASETKIDGTLNTFSVELMQVVIISFDEFRFSSGTGRSTEVVVKLAAGDPFVFKGALEFVRKLTEIIPPGIFGNNGPRIILRPDAVEVGFALALPPAALGVFSIRNIAISTSLVLPFLSGRPSIAFAFATREKPFQITVLILGGGGFVRVELDTERVRAVEVLFEFGGMFALDVGVASGSVHILAGIYIGLKGTASELTGYVRVGGEVTALAIVSVSIEFMLSLSLFPGPPAVAKGVAKVSISVRIAFISVSVSFSVERKFAGGSRHLSIAEAMTPDDWAEYAGAFA